jgi:hypothetical protein
MNAYRIAKMFLAFAACGSLSGFASSAASDADIPLRPNERAPAGASGVARFETENGAATLAITLQGLSPGVIIVEPDRGQGDGGLQVTVATLACPCGP